MPVFRRSVVFASLLVVCLTSAGRSSAAEITLVVIRGDAWNGYLRDYDVYLNDRLVGAVANKSTAYLKVNIEPVNRVYCECSSLFGAITARTEIVEFNAIDGDVVSVEFTSSESQPIPLRFKHLGNPAAEERKRLEQEAIDFHAYVTSELSLAPEWFKSRTRPALDEKMRKSLLPDRMLQCQPVLRLLGLLVLLYPVLAWMSYRIAWSQGVESIGLALVAPVVGFLLLFPISYVVELVVNLLVYVVTGEDYYIPYQFAFFATLAATLAGFVLFSIAPLAAMIRHGLPRHKLLGGAAISLEVLSILFTLREIYQLAAR